MDKFEKSGIKPAVMDKIKKIAEKYGVKRVILFGSRTRGDYQRASDINEDVWLDMLKSRNDMTHIYDGDAAKRLVNDILYRYIPEFIKLRENIVEQYEEVLSQI